MASESASASTATVVCSKLDVEESYKLIRFVEAKRLVEPDSAAGQTSMARCWEYFEDLRPLGLLLKMLICVSKSSLKIEHRPVIDQGEDVYLESKCEDNTAFGAKVLLQRGNVVHVLLISIVFIGIDRAHSMVIPYLIRKIRLGLDCDLDAYVRMVVAIVYQDNIKVRKCCQSSSIYPHLHGEEVNCDDF
ncbi:hypothetical protein Tco_0865044 [Tanacetum coccineum]